MRLVPSVLLSLMVVLCAAACGGDERSAVATNQGDTTTLEQDRDVVVVAGRRGDTVIEGRGEGCVEIDDLCVEASEIEERYCDGEDAHADIVVDEDGEVLSAVCYPSVEEAQEAEDVLVDSEGVATLPQNSNGTIAVFPESTDNKPVEGDITLSGERAILVGRGMSKTIIDGSVKIDSNNARLRGMTINQDLKIDSNNVGVSFVRVMGKLDVNKNGFVGMNIEVFGDVNIGGSSAVLHNIGVQGEWKGETTCVGCYSFADDNADGLIQDAEISDAPFGS